MLSLGGAGTQFAHNLAGSVAHKIMSRYGFKEGQGLGKGNKGISHALQVLWTISYIMYILLLHNRTVLTFYRLKRRVSEEAKLYQVHKLKNK